MRILTMIRLRLLRWARTLQLRRLFLASFAFRCQWSWPGQTWHSGPPLVHCAERLRFSVVEVMMASMSVSKGLAWWVVETSDTRDGAFSADGMFEDRVSCDGLSFKGLTTVRPSASFSLRVMEAMANVGVPCKKPCL